MGVGGALRRRLLVVLAVISLAACWPAPAAEAAGMQTHAWMADEAIDRVQHPKLRALLRAHVVDLRAGARFPDGGYGPGNTYGEEAHWQRFHDALMEVIRSKPECGDLTAVDGPCARDIAFLFGVIAHGTGDEVWDWLFEPYSPDLNEYYLPPELSFFNDGGGQELTMDFVTLGVHGEASPEAPPYTSVPDLQAAFRAAGMPSVSAEELERGRAFVNLAATVEQSWVPAHLPGVLANMPWMSAHLVDAPGGIDYAATSIAAQWDTQWRRLLDRPVRTRVGNHYPADRQRGIPATGWVRSYQPGSSPGRGGARTRIAVSLTDALPYGRPGGPAASTRLADGSITLTDDRGRAVPILAGFPRAVPYGAEAGEHTAGLQPAVDLQPCTWYRVATTRLLVDADGDPVTPETWRFRTGRDASGTRCPDDPVDPGARRAGR